MTRPLFTGGNRIGRTTMIQVGNAVHQMIAADVVFTPEAIAELENALVLFETRQLAYHETSLLRHLHELRENGGELRATFDVNYGEAETRIMHEIFARDRAAVRPDLNQLVTESIVRRENPLARHDLPEELIRPPYCQCCGKPASEFGGWEAQACSLLETLCYECGIQLALMFEQWAPEVELEESVDSLREMVARGVEHPPATEALWLHWEERTNHDRADL